MKSSRQEKFERDVATYKDDGRVSRWESKYQGADSCQKALDCLSGGMSVVETAAQMGISKVTFYAWLSKYPAFNKAVEVGRTMQEADWTKRGRENLNDTTFQTPLYKFLSVNQFGWLSERQAMEHSGEVGLALRPVDEGERRERAELARLRAAGEIERLRSAAVEAETRAVIEAVPAGAKVKAIPEETGGK